MELKTFDYNLIKEPGADIVHNNKTLAARAFGIRLPLILHRICDP